MLFVNWIFFDSLFFIWFVVKVYYDVYNLGLIFEDDGFVNGLKKYWVMILECFLVNG